MKKLVLFLVGILSMLILVGCSFGSTEEKSFKITNLEIASEQFSFHYETNYDSSLFLEVMDTDTNTFAICEEFVPTEDSYFEYTGLTPDTNYELKMKLVLVSVGSVKNTRILETKTFKTDYLDTTAPVVKVKNNPLVCSLGSDYKKLAMENLTITDNHDGAITVTLEMVSVPEITAKGSYTISYDVKDNKNNHTTGSFEMTVWIDDEAPVVTVKQPTITLNYGSNYTEAILANVTATDNYDGKMTIKESMFTIPEITGKGSYTISYEISDYAGNKATGSFTLVVLTDEQAPVVTVNKNPLTLDVDDDYVVAILSNVSATDNFDGTIKITKDMFTIPEITGKGSYTIAYTVSDKASNEATGSFTLIIASDEEAPIVTVPATISVVSGEDYEAIILKQMTANDARDGAITVTKDMITIPEITGVGDYTVTYSVSDKAGNVCKGSFVLHISASNDAPVIETAYLTYSYDTVSDVPDLKTLFTIYDATDGDITPTNTMLSIQNSDLVDGINYVTLNAVDSDSHVTSKTINVLVNANYTVTHLSENITKVDPNYMPSTGNVRVLVIPVSIGTYAKTEEMRETIYKGFFGTEEETGWESLSSYYEKSSYGKLHISGVVTDWYQAKKSQNYYATYSDSNNYIYGSTMILDEALTYFKNTYNYSDFDSNNDDCIDAVYLVYNVPIGGNQSIKEKDFYWAFTYWDYYERDYGQKASGYSYMFASYEFFSEELYYATKENQPKINAETFIHESGHIMGLDDYYDYDDSDSYNNDGGYGGSDMMDWNIGDHNPFSKMLLDWVDPIVLTKSGTYVLPSFTDTGMFFVIPASGTFSGVFSEYFVIDFYTFSGLNAVEMPRFFGAGGDYAGVRVSLVNGVIAKGSDGYYSFTYNNTDTKYKVIRMMEADYNGTSFDIDQGTDAEGYSVGAELTDFFTPTSASFGDGKFASYKTAANKVIPFTMTVKSISGANATVEITFK